MHLDKLVFLSVWPLLLWGLVTGCHHCFRAWQAASSASLKRNPERVNSSTPFALSIGDATSSHSECQPISQGRSAVCSACCLIKPWKMRLAQARYRGKKKRSCKLWCFLSLKSRSFSHTFPRESERVPAAECWNRM